MRLFITIAIMVLMTGAFPLSAQQRIKEVEFEGNRIISDDELMDQLNTQPKTSFGKLLFWKPKPEFIFSVFEEDIQRLKNFYIRNGFINPEISYDLDSARSGRIISARIQIDENDFISVGTVRIHTETNSIAREVTDSAKKNIPLRSGERFTDNNVFRTRDILRESFYDNGFPYVKVSFDLELRDSNRIADVTFDTDPGRISYFGDISVTGDSLVPEKFIRKYLLFSEGDVYKQSRIDSSQQEIFDTDLFRYVVIAPKKDSAENNRIPVEIVVSELPRWKLETGTGYGTEDRLRLSAELRKLNFLGGTRKLIINAKTSYFLPFSIDIRFIQPDLVIPKLDFVLNPFILREREVSYSIDRMGGGIRFLYPVNRNIISHFSYAFEYDRILELDDTLINAEELKHNKSVFSIGAEVNSSDDPFYPSKGYRIDGTASYAGIGYSGAARYYKIQVSFIRYFSLAEDLVFASRLKAGVIQTTRPDRRTPIEERFYLGGASSLRGWGRHRISPLSESGLLLGGNTMAEGSAELRFPVYDLLHGVIFMDAGNVWSESYRLDSDLHYDAGAGLRLRTPIGPVRLDFATPVINDSFDLQFFISIGHAF